MVSNLRTPVFRRKKTKSIVSAVFSRSTDRLISRSVASFLSFLLHTLVTMNQKIEEVKTNTTNIVKMWVFKSVLEYLNYKELVQLRRINKGSVSPLVSGSILWDRLSDMQEKRALVGKRVFLFEQYMMSREDAQRLPVSKKYY